MRCSSWKEKFLHSFLWILFFDITWNGTIWKSIILMKLSFLFWKIQMPIINVQQEVRSKRSVMLVVPVTFPSWVTLKTPNSNRDNSKTFDTGFGPEGRRRGEEISNHKITRKKYQAVLAKGNFWWLDMWLFLLIFMHYQRFQTSHLCRLNSEEVSGCLRIWKH